MASSDPAKAQNIHRTGNDASGTPHTLDIIHRPARDRVACYVDPHVAVLRADTAANTFLFVGKDPVLAELSINVHQRSKRTTVPAPDSARIEEVDAQPDRSSECGIDDHTVPVDEVVFEFI